MQNEKLRTLIVSNNGIESRACFTICVGVLEHPSLRHVAMDGNPVGIDGAKALMLVPLLAGERVEVTSKGCNVQITSAPPRPVEVKPVKGAAKTPVPAPPPPFNLSAPCGEYSLDLSQVPPQPLYAPCMTLVHGIRICCRRLNHTAPSLSPPPLLCSRTSARWRSSSCGSPPPTRRGRWPT